MVGRGGLLSTLSASGDEGPHGLQRLSGLTQQHHRFAQLGGGVIEPGGLPGGMKLLGDLGFSDGVGDAEDGEPRRSVEVVVRL